MALSSRASVRFTRRDVGRLRDLEARLSEVSPVPDTSAPVPEWLPAAFSELLDCPIFGAYRPSRDEGGGWAMPERIATDEPLFAAYSANMAAGHVAFFYDPLRPQAAQRDVARCLHEVHGHGPETTCFVEETWPKLGIGGHDQLRVLVCDGPSMLSWVGGFRDEAFSMRERALLSALVPALKHALSLRRRLLDADIASAGLASALEALGAPTFVAYRDGRIAHSNSSGAMLVDRDRTSARDRIRGAIAGRDVASLVARLDTASGRECFLVVLREGPPPLEARLRAAAREWSLTSHEVAVLRWLVHGDANKEIAIKLGRSEVSIEGRVTSLLRKARCDGRSRLVARFWSAF